MDAMKTISERAGGSGGGRALELRADERPAFDVALVLPSGLTLPLVCPADGRDIAPPYKANPGVLGRLRRWLLGERVADDVGVVYARSFLKALTAPEWARTIDGLDSGTACVLYHQADGVVRAWWEAVERAKVAKFVRLLEEQGKGHGGTEARRHGVGGGRNSESGATGSGATRSGVGGVGGVGEDHWMAPNGMAIPVGRGKGGDPRSITVRGDGTVRVSHGGVELEESSRSADQQSSRGGGKK